MSTSFDVNHRKAKDILSQNADNESISRFAYHLLEMEKEKKIEILEIKKDMEKKLEVLEIKKDMEMELQKQKMMQKQLQSDAFHLKELSAVVQRLVICLYVLCFFSFFRHLHQFFASSVFCLRVDKCSRTF